VSPAEEWKRSVKERYTYTNHKVRNELLVTSNSNVLYVGYMYVHSCKSSNFAIPTLTSTAYYTITFS